MPLFRARTAFLSAALAAASLSLTAPAGNASESPDRVPLDATLCLEATAAAEALSGVPKDLLHAIFLSWSGVHREAAGARVAWPWTINVEGEGRYFDTKQAAVDGVRALIRSGVYSIDIGCMQLNYRWHGENFRSVEHILEPERNISYAARFLRRRRLSISTKTEKPIAK